MDSKEKAYDIGRFFYPITLVCSLVHNWIYLNTLGISVSKINITISDILNDSLIWAPPVLIMMFFSLFLSAIILRSDKGKTQTQLKSECKNKKIAFILYDLPLILGKVMIYMISTCYVLFPKMVSGIPAVALTFSFLFILDWAISHDVILEKLKILFDNNPFRLITIMLIAPTLLLYSIISGYKDATVDYDNKNTQSILHSLHSREQIDNVVVMRTYEKISIMKNPKDNTIFLINNESVKNIIGRDNTIYRYDGYKTVRKFMIGITAVRLRIDANS